MPAPSPIIKPPRYAGLALALRFGHALRDWVRAGESESRHPARTVVRRLNLTELAPVRSPRRSRLRGLSSGVPIRAKVRSGPHWPHLGVKQTIACLSSPSFVSAATCVPLRSYWLRRLLYLIKTGNDPQGLAIKLDVCSTRARIAPRQDTPGTRTARAGTTRATLHNPRPFSY